MPCFNIIQVTIKKGLDGPHLFSRYFYEALTEDPYLNRPLKCGKLIMVEVITPVKIFLGIIIEV